MDQNQGEKKSPLKRQREESSEVEIVEQYSGRTGSNSGGRPKVVDDLMAEMECSICFNPMAYTFMMPCQHNYCYECLKGTATSAITTNSSSSSSSNNNMNNAKFKCPQCLKESCLKHCLPNLKLDQCIDIMISNTESDSEYSNYKLRSAYGKQLHLHPNSKAPPPVLAAPKPYVPLVTTNTKKVAREQNRANRKANNNGVKAAPESVFDLT
jgi:hypothetical protein